MRERKRECVCVCVCECMRMCVHVVSVCVESKVGQQGCLRFINTNRSTVYFH